MREMYRLLRAVVLLVSVGNVEIASTLPLSVHVRPVHLEQYYELTSKSMPGRTGCLAFLSADSVTTADVRQPSAQPASLSERIIARIKNNPIVAALIALGTVIIALGTFTDALKKLLDPITRNRAQAAREKLGRMGLKYEARDFVESARKSDLHAVKTFLAAEMKPNARGYEGRTALSCAVEHENSKIIHALLRRKADVNQTDDHRCTPLTWAIFKRNREILRLLLKHGAKADTIDQAFVTAACRVDTESLRILLEKGADVTKVGAEALVCAAAAHDRDTNDEAVSATCLSLMLIPMLRMTSGPPCFMRYVRGTKQ